MTFPSLDDVDRSPMPVMCRARNYAAELRIPDHSHMKCQLIYALHGVVVVASAGGHWVVPSTRGIWMPAGTTHRIRCVGAVQMRSIYVAPDAVPGLPAISQVVGISPLLRELIQAASRIVLPYAEDSRDGRLMRLLLDELQVLPVLPLHLPQPADAGLQRICDRLRDYPDDPTTLGAWAGILRIDVKTIQRRFARETGMTFGQWRQQARLLQGLERLANGEKVLDVALALGYDSPSAFATMFKRHFGQRPSEFFR
ncbi:helix-turn-helix transcriptional regulator [Robbsia sp. Bb-Pol-6]|uniref:Helix-turn-helix transcriptional regulator n=1 Tax=Robbsia betulipollinis TaxID=2981849 RepID=A0ABT3ZI40_9BURK|nr:helix-turn-helix transcriptional regulator [Robbsia betulipollinis]MCY0386127.1 helix-turn-helix transcriptional regulator [Robbsia betulipollinis]